MPSVSVIIAVCNGEQYLDASLESVLEQTHSPIEIIVVDDGSWDSTRTIVQKYGSKVRYFFQSNRGQPSAQNLGISIAESPYITFLDADDLHMPNKTCLQIEFLEANPQVDFVFGHMSQFFSPDISSETQKKWLCPSAISPGYMAASGLFRKKRFEQVGYFNEQQRIGSFIEWYMRAEEKGLKSGLIPQQVLQRRIHENNMGIRSQFSRLEYVRIVKTALERRQLGDSIG